VKRIAAVAALIIAMLAVPAAAMASTASSGSGSGHPGQGQFCQPNQFNHRHHGRHHGRHHRHHRFGSNQCPFFPPVPPAGVCQGQSFTFTWAHDSNSFFEESGPTLFAGEQFSFEGNVFTIGTANGGAGSYTTTTVNYGPSIFYGTGFLCSSYG
jgi:hypothetical protein